MGPQEQLEPQQLEQPVQQLLELQQPLVLRPLELQEQPLLQPQQVQQQQPLQLQQLRQQPQLQQQLQQPPQQQQRPLLPPNNLYATECFLSVRKSLLCVGVPTELISQICLYQQKGGSD